MNKSSKAITLVLLGSAAALAGYSALDRSGSPPADESAETASDFGDDAGPYPSSQPSGGSTRTTRSYHSTGTGYHTSSYSSSRYRTGTVGGYRRTGTSSWSSGSSSSGSSGSSGSSAGVGSHTSRGGFGSSGHAVSS